MFIFQVDDEQSKICDLASISSSSIRIEEHWSGRIESKYRIFFWYIQLIVLDMPQACDAKGEFGSYNIRAFRNEECIRPENAVHRGLQTIIGFRHSNCYVPCHKYFLRHDSRIRSRHPFYLFSGPSNLVTLKIRLRSMCKLLPEISDIKEAA